MSSVHALISYFFSCLIAASLALPEQGKWEYQYTIPDELKNIFIPKSLFEGSEIFISIDCFPHDPNTPVSLKISWTLGEMTCWNDYLQISSVDAPQHQNHSIGPFTVTKACSQGIELDDHSHNQNSPGTSSKKMDSSVQGKLPSEPQKSEGTSNRRKREDAKKVETAVRPRTEKSVAIPSKLKSTHSKGNRVYTIEADGIYLLTLVVVPIDPRAFVNLSISVEMVGPHGYLSAVDWPLLPFYGAMCLTYVILGLAWLVVSFCQWRDLLRIQFWIGGVILLGMLEKATFYAEYQSINSTGVSVKGAVLLAELVSCGKRMLARMLVIIVSLGFGIVKPRLGPMLHRVVFVGILYFILASIESYLRVMHQKNDSSNQILVASIPLAVLDSAICWWIFTSLVQTTRTLRVRRNLVKLSLYRHFTNTLIFSVVSSVVFMLYSIRYHRLIDCLTDWKELWVDDAYWHLLFSILLLVIMILWRPTNNNQRYAFTPLLDAPEDDEDEDEQFVNDAFGVKMRGYRSNSPKPKQSNSVEDDLKWVEENIPSSMADTALPILDSEEEIMTAKYEASKMQ